MIEDMSHPEYIEIVEARCADILNAVSVKIDMNYVVERAIDTYAFVDLNFGEDQHVKDALFAGLNLGLKLLNTKPVKPVVL